MSRRETFMVMLLLAGPDLMLVAQFCWPDLEQSACP